VHHDVGAERERVAQVGTGDGVVDHQRDAVLVRDGGDGLDVEHVDARIAERLAVHGTRGRPDRLAESPTAHREAETAKAHRG